MTLDPVTLTVIQNGLRQVASEMDLVHEKTSFSPVISEGFDRSNGIYDRTTGEVVAQGELGLPIFCRGHAHCGAASGACRRANSQHLGPGPAIGHYLLDFGIRWRIRAL
jgi:N-methylhydantoinase B/oxoprolinase/acetone carboxylase alpha subunit